MAKKLSSRFGMSHKGIREAVKAGVIPSAKQSREEFVACYGRNAWNRLQVSNRIARTRDKATPVYDMDGSYYHG